MTSRQIVWTVAVVHAATLCVLVAISQRPPHSLVFTDDKLPRCNVAWETEDIMGSFLISNTKKVDTSIHYEARITHDAGPYARVRVRDDQAQRIYVLEPDQSLYLVCRDPAPECRGDDERHITCI